jgi:hypothetical protein
LFIPDPDPHFLPILDPGSRGQKGTEYRIPDPQHWFTNKEERNNSNHTSYKEDNNNPSIIPKKETFGLEVMSGLFLGGLTVSALNHPRSSLSSLIQVSSGSDS